ncbi:arrestin (or s-antigen) N-terminal domain-containing protein [Cyclospora cayetanensis]|uniref:Arrestin (Or s-antigen) N-terminal domain-containing protein n=1 Tax=Cyclospora cayetanensis TaxID=88456 RepID=A0A1D3D6X8_9EIME|nr:arrestin (or s-antigen) N-terminal domain-containing protein [Cyclospora cayetanensis]
MEMSRLRVHAARLAFVIVFMHPGSLITLLPSGGHPHGGRDLSLQFIGKPEMGLEFSKVTGAKIFVTQAQYEVGQHVSGEVFVNVLSEIEFSRLTLDVSGIEAITFKSPPRRQLCENGSPPKSVEAKERKEIFRSKATLYEPPDGRLSPGHYRFPFIFVLPLGIPGSVSVAGADVSKDEAGEYNAEVKYLIRADFEDCLICVKDVHSFTIAVPPSPASAAPISARESATGINEAAIKVDSANKMASGGTRDGVSATNNDANDSVAAVASAIPTASPQTGDGIKRFPLKLGDLLEIFVVEPLQQKAPPHMVEQTIRSRRFLPCLKPHLVVVGVGLTTSLYQDGGSFSMTCMALQVGQFINALQGLPPCHKALNVCVYVYVLGAVLEVFLEMENPSNYSLTEVVLGLWRVTTLRAPGLRPYVVRNRMVYQQVSYIPPGYFLKGENAMRAEVEIPFDLQQSVKGSLFDVNYEVTLTADFRKTGMDIRDNIVIRKRLTQQDEYLKEFEAPPGWDTVELATDIIQIQLEGAPEPSVGNYEGIGYITVSEKKVSRLVCLSGPQEQREDYPLWLL